MVRFAPAHPERSLARTVTVTGSPVIRESRIAELKKKGAGSTEPRPTNLRQAQSEIGLGRRHGGRGIPVALAWPQDSQEAIPCQPKNISWSGDLSLARCVRLCGRKQHTAARLQQPDYGRNRMRRRVVFEAISGGVFRALAGAVPSRPAVFQVPPMVAGDDGRRPNTAHNIWNRENCVFAPKALLGDKSIRIWVCNSGVDFHVDAITV